MLKPPSKLLKPLGFLRFAVLRFFEDRCPQVAASLTYTTLLALVPLITVAVTIFAAFPVFSDLTTQLKIFMLTNMVPEMAGKIITVYMEQFSNKAAKLTLIGIAGLTVTALLLMNTIDRTFNNIWRVHKPRRILQRILTYWTVLTVGPLILGASLSITFYLVRLSLGYMQHIPLVGETALKLVPIILMSLAFALLYFTVPNRFVPFRHALLGGLLAGISFELMKRLFTLYITKFPTYTLVYGTFAAIPIFLLWVYLSWLVILLGAEIAATLSHWRAGTWQASREPGWHFIAALQILQALAQAQASGHTINLANLRKRVDFGLEEIEEVLHRLEQNNLARRTEKDAWLLSRAPQDIQLAEVYRLFVFDPSQLETLPAIYRDLITQLKTAQQATLTPALADLAGDRPA